MSADAIARTARDVDRIFVDAMNRGDIDAVMSLYSEDTVFVQAPGEPVLKGLTALRETIEQFLAMKPKLKVELMQYVEADDIAFFTVRWELTGTDAAGIPVFLTSYDGNVVRRQADGSWKTLIDNPFHSQHLGLT